MNQAPNLFNYATSELSQDAFLCWLLQWGDADYQAVNEPLHKLGKAFVNLLLNESDEKSENKFSKISIRLQEEKIDILCEIDDKHLIVIEDKVGSKEHDGQLQRYKKYAEKKYPERTLHLIYLQTEDQGDYSAAVNEGYLVIKRPELLALLQSSTDIATEKPSDILRDFSAHLAAKEAETQAYATVPVVDWGWKQWIGFYQELQNKFGKGNWGQVKRPGRAGAFLGWWWWPIDDMNAYVQIEQIDPIYEKTQMGRGVLRFKLEAEVADSVESKKQAVKKWATQLIDLFTKEKIGIEKTKPHVDPRTKTMTLAQFTSDFPVATEGGLIDFEKTLAQLEQIKKLWPSASQ